MNNEFYFTSQHIYQNKILWQQAVEPLDDVYRRIFQLRQAQQVFAQKSVEERCSLLAQLAERLTDNQHILAKMICEEVGRCLKECEAEIQKSIALIKYYTTLAPELLATKNIPTQASISCVAFEPLGVIFAVMPWNYPVWQILRFAVPALCAGNACLVKPAPTVGRVSRTLFDLVGDLLPLQGAFIHHIDVESTLAQCDGLAFTGSVVTGRHLAQLAGKHLKKCVLELGGSNAFIVLPDADILTCATDAFHSRFRDAGQSCNAGKRIILVNSPNNNVFLRHFLSLCHTLKYGDPMQPETTLASLHLPQTAPYLQALVNDAINQGAKCLIGGQWDGNPHYYPPTVLDYVPVNARIAQEEVFGPVAVIMRARSPEEAVKIANHSPYGLGASIYSQNTHTAWQYAQQLQTGSVFINRHTSSDLRLPFGGIKDSGFGRELSEFGIYEFVNIKSYWQK